MMTKANLVFLHTTRTLPISSKSKSPYTCNIIFLSSFGRWFSLGLSLQGSWWAILEATTVPEAINKAVTLCEFEGQKLFTWQIRVCPGLSASSQSLFWTDQRLTQYLGPWQQTQKIEAEVAEATKTFCFLVLNGDSILPLSWASKDKTWLSGVQKLSHWWWFNYLSCITPQFHTTASHHALCSGHT